MQIDRVAVLVPLTWAVYLVIHTLLLVVHHTCLYYPQYLPVCESS